MRKKFRADEIAVAWTSFTWGDGVIRRGSRLRGDAPAVRAKPQHFVPDGVPFPNEFQYLPEPAQDESQALKAHLARLPDDQCAIAIQTFSIGLGRGVRGHFIQKGQRLALTDPLVKAHPELFRTPAMRLPENE